MGRLRPRPIRTYRDICRAILIGILVMIGMTLFLALIIWLVSLWTQSY